MPNFKINDIAKYGYKHSLLQGLNLLLTSIGKNDIIKFKPSGSRSDVYMRRNSSDIMAFKQIFIWEEYDFPILGEVKCIIDGGANIGCTTVWFANKYQQAKIISIEPDEGNFNMLLKNTNSYNNVTCVKKGIWDKSCNLRVEANETGHWGLRVYETNDITGIPAISIGELVKQHQIETIDILKLDIEGTEKCIFEADVAEWLPKVKYLFIETHDYFLKGSSRAVLQATLKYDFSLYALGENLVFVNNKMVS